MKQDLTPIDDLAFSFGTRSLVDFNCSHTQSTNLNKSHVGFTVWDSDEDDDDVKRIDNGDKKKLDESRKEGVWISEGVAKWDDDIKKKTIDNEARELKSIMRQSQCDRVKRPIAVALGVFVAILVFVAFAVGLFYFLTKGTVLYGGFCLGDGNCRDGANLYCKQAYCECKFGAWILSKCA